MIVWNHICVFSDGLKWTQVNRGELRGGCPVIVWTENGEEHVHFDLPYQLLKCPELEEKLAQGSHIMQHVVHAIFTLLCTAGKLQFTSSEAEWMNATNNGRVPSATYVETQAGTQFFYQSWSAIDEHTGEIFIPVEAPELRLAEAEMWQQRAGIAYFVTFSVVVRVASYCSL